MFTARYELSPYIKQIRFAFKVLSNYIQKLYLYCWTVCVITICDIPEDESVIGLKHVGLQLNVLM
jgi:hypothetical protein